MPASALQISAKRCVESPNWSVLIPKRFSNADIQIGHRLLKLSEAFLKQDCDVVWQEFVRVAPRGWLFTTERDGYILSVTACRNTPDF